MTPIRKILIVGDPNLRKNLAEEFVAAPEFEPIESEDLTSALQNAGACAPDILLLDDALAKPDAASTIGELRKAGFDRPILLLCADRRPLSLPPLCERMSRPFRFADLLARIRSLLRREARRSNEVLPIGPYDFRPLSGDLTRGETIRLRLTEIESAILARLARAGGASVSRDVLLRDVWGYNPTVSTHTLETHIHRLRRKMERDPAKPSLLVTEAGGYRLASEDLHRAAAAR
jgi:DNA-binding response OmpR family regulator